MDGLPFTSDGTSSYSTQPQTVPPYSASHTNSYNEPSSSYVTTHQMLPQQLPSHYGSSILLPSPKMTKRTRGESMDDGEHNSNHIVGMKQSFISGDGSISIPEPPDILYPVNTNYAPSRAGPGHGFPSPMTLPPPQHHYHHLPPQTSLFLGSNGRRPCSRSGNGGHISVVGQPGMPAPFPRPPVARTRFTPEMDRMIVELKENIGLEWKQVMDFFPGRNYNTLQVRYCKKLKERDVNWTNELVSALQHWQHYHTILTGNRCNDCGKR